MVEKKKHVARDTIWPNNSNILVRTVFLHVGQGSSAVVFIADGDSYLVLLVDTNKDSKSGGINVPRMMKDLLDGGSLYAFVNTHPHDDHICDVKELSEAITIDRVWHSNHRPSKKHGSKFGGWLRFPRVPVLPPWQTPFTWGDFRKVCQNQGISLDQFLRRIGRYLREGDSHLLIGFPFPATVGGQDEQMHWQAIQLKPSDELTGSYPGFRPGAKEAIWLEMRQKLTRDKDKIMWKDSQNWAGKELVSRGALPAQLVERKVLLIGAGALGSAVAELLLRAGVYNITILDGQDLRAGNLCRHTLGIQDLEKKKAWALAKRLGGAGPHAVVEAITTNFPPTKPDEIAKVQECDLIIDCTAEDDVLQAMSVFPWKRGKVFASFSLGFAAKRLFCFVEESTRFPLQDFKSVILPWLKRDEAERGNVELPREGLGCWHPVFPARIDDVWMLAAIAVKQLAIAMESSFVTTGLTVFEQAIEKDTFVGVRRIGCSSSSP